MFNRIAIAILLALCVTGAQAQDKTVQLKLSSWVPPAHPLNPALQAWGEDIDKASGGTIKSTLFPSEQLGKAMDHYDMARDGIADFTYVNPGYQPGRFPIIAAGELPFLIGNAKGGSAALDAWYRKYAAAEMKDTHFCFAFVLDPGTFHSRAKKIVTAGGSARHEGADPAMPRWVHLSPCWAERMCRPPRPRRAKCWSAAWPMRSPSPGSRSSCSASTR